MKILLVPIFSLGLLMLSGCTTWKKDGGNEQGFYRDSSFCMAQCGQGCGARGCALICQHLYDNCMMGKGYYKE